MKLIIFAAVFPPHFLPSNHKVWFTNLTQKKSPNINVKEKNRVLCVRIFLQHFTVFLKTLAPKWSPNIKYNIMSKGFVKVRWDNFELSKILKNMKVYNCYNFFTLRMSHFNSKRSFCRYLYAVFFMLRDLWFGNYCLKF